MTVKYLSLDNASETDGLTLDDGVEGAKNLFKSNNKPYTLRDSVEGPNTKVVFAAHFIEMFRSAQSTECMDGMSQLEKELYWDYLAYQDAILGIVTDPEDPGYAAELTAAYELEVQYNTPELVVEQLDQYEVAEVYDLAEDNCFTYQHVWEE